MSKYKDRIEFDEEGFTHNLTYLKPAENGHTPANTSDDIDKLDNSGCFFSRKFDLNVDKNAVMYYYNKICK